MGIFPQFFADRLIKLRIPYAMPGELALAASSSGVQFPQGVFLHNVDKPFEIHKVRIKLIPLDSTGLTIDVDVATINDQVRLSILDTSKNEQITKNPALVSLLIDQQTRMWDWEMPYTIVRQESFQVTCDGLAYPVVCAPGIVTACTAVARTITSIRVEISFLGYLLVLALPSESR